jgi:hypothetical protein
MKYTLIKGTYHVVGQSPDADSIKFRAASPTLWNEIDTENRDIFTSNFTAENGVITVRLEGIDALETHYSAPSLIKGEKARGYSQPRDLGRLAANAFLDYMGVTEVKWRTFGKSTYISQAKIDGQTLKTKLTDSIPGYIITGDIEKNGRPVAWVFRGETSLADGAAVPREKLADLAATSANAHLLRTGMVYPFFFMTLAATVRSALVEAVKQAQVAAPGQPNNIWTLDHSMRGIDLTSVRVITDEKALYPYLFRKVIKHLQRVEFNRKQSGITGDETIPLAGFFNDANPHVFVISEQDFLRLDDVVEARGTTIRMKKPPHDIVFLS